MPEYLQVMESWDGFASVRDTRVSEAAIAAAISLITNRDRMPAYQHRYMMEAAMRGDIRLREAITTDSFPYLLGHILDRQVLARYKAHVADWKSYIKVVGVRDFNTVRRHKVYGNDNYLPEVAEKGEYLVSPHNEARYTYSISKRGRQFDVSWEALVNDSLNALADIPARFATAVIRTEARLATSLYSSAAGPNVLLFGAPIADVDGANVTNTGTLGLTIANLETTLALMAAQVDANGEPILVRGVHLVVPPALEFTARQILTSALKMWTESAGGGATPYPMTNVIPQVGLQLHIDPYLPVVDATANDDTTWYLFADPAEGAAMEFGYLRGHEEPEICMKAADKVTVAGAPLSPFSGDFATDNVFYRVRIACGGGQLDPRYAYSQNGTT